MKTIKFLQESFETKEGFQQDVPRLYFYWIGDSSSIKALSFIFQQCLSAPKTAYSIIFGYMSVSIYSLHATAPAFKIQDYQASADVAVFFKQGD